MSETDLWALVARAQAVYDALPPEERAAHDAAQRESWARGNLAIDALIAERAALLYHQDAARKRAAAALP